MRIERLPSPFRCWRIYTIEYPLKDSYVTLSDDEMAEVMQVVLGKKPNGCGEEPDDLLRETEARERGWEV